jgi:hypothetical protein
MTSVQKCGYEIEWPNLLKHNFTDTLPPKSPCWTRTDIESTLKNATTFEKYPRQRFQTKAVINSLLASYGVVDCAAGHLIELY